MCVMQVLFLGKGLLASEEGFKLARHALAAKMRVAFYGDSLGGNVRELAQTVCRQRIDYS